jgi:hypothetical protein
MGRTTETNSLEVRWFGTGTTPRDLDEWFAGLGPVETSTRTDRYLSPFGPAFNLKLRSEGGEFVEMKRRLADAGRRDFGPDVTGRVEQWYKWSFPLDHRPDLWTTDRTGLWLPVEKTRSLRVLDDAELRPLDDDVPWTDVTAHVEVTEVAALGETAWTCGLEATGPVDELERAVTLVGAELFGADVPVALPVERSFGYAEWLGRLAGDVRPESEVLVPSNR